MCVSLEMKTISLCTVINIILKYAKKNVLISNENFWQINPSLFILLVGGLQSFEPYIQRIEAYL